MQVTNLQFKVDSRWSPALPTSMDGPQTLVLVYGPRAMIDQPQALHELAQAFPSSVLMGCSSAGDFSSDQVSDAGLSAVVAHFDHTLLRRVSTPLHGVADSLEAGRRLAAGLAPEGLRAVFLLCSGVAVNGSALVRGLNQALPKNVTVSGGLAADGSLFERTWVLNAGVPAENIATAVGFYGDALNLGHGCSGGWVEFGPERKVTRSEENVLYELDGKPALSLYKHYLGEMAAQLPGSALLFPLALRAQSADDNALVRTILSVDEAKQSMTFAGDLPEGSLVRLMRTSIDGLITSAEQAGSQAMQTLGTQAAPSPVLALSTSCVGRRLVMGERTDEEVEAVLEQLPAGSAHCGFYSYGEIASSQASGLTELHNQTLTLTILSEG